ncbi:carboxypeptidase B-like [Ptychodera flava]|uniref:carboxypeptidase B-like n=1 Tax=Ptychodera flava TaxID=63121 RepID=UPI00396A264F
MLQGLLFVLLAISSCFAEKRYDGYQVLRADVKSDDMKVMKELLNSLEADFWDFPRDVMVEPSHLGKIKGIFDSNGIQYSVWIDDVQRLIDDQFSISSRLSEIDSFDYSVYHTYEEIQQWVLDTASNFPDLASSFVVTMSYEARQLNALLIGSPSETPKEAIWIQGGIHAREWISPATVMWMTNQLLEDYTTDAEVKAMLDRFDIYVLPLLNADGYAHTWGGERMWRKTRSPNDGSACVGTDANRNWDIKWAEPGAGSIPCSSTYHGPSPHSEPEVKGVAAFIEETSLTQTYRMFLDVHSYSQYWLSPYGYTATHPVDYATQTALAVDACAAIEAVNGTHYSIGTFEELLYLGSGVSQDWAYDVANITYSYTIELRDTGEYGFILPEDQIIPSGVETYEGLKAAIRYIMNNP